MDLSRQEYPALLASLQPSQAVTVLNDRVSLISKVNSDIADWLQERRRIEEAYAAGLRRLARRPQQDGAAALGIFQMPWQRIVSGTENLAQSHETLAAKIETDVENPLRLFATKNREMTSMTTIQGNLASISKDIESAQKRVDKLKDKGGKGDKYANAASSSDDASREWDTQAPYVFEQLQALDETRVNHLRDVLTQFQTHEVDQIERNRVSAESCLNALLNIETADEIKTFAARVGGGQGNATRRTSSATASTQRPISSMGPPPTPPPRLTRDSYSQQSGLNNPDGRLAPVQGKTPSKSSFGGIKRGLGTVIGRRKSQVPIPPSSLEKPKKEKTSRSFAPFRRGDSSQSFQDLERTGRDLTPVTSPEERAVPVRQPSFDRSVSTDGPMQDTLTPTITPALNGTHPQGSSPQTTQRSSNLVNSTESDFTPPSGPPPSQIHQPQELSAVPSTPEVASADPIGLAQQDTALANANNEESARNLMIRDQPIPEDETEAQNAMHKVSNQLRMQAPNRVQGSMRGRRDVRNTVFMPNNPESPSTGGISTGAGVLGLGVAAGVGAAAIGAADIASPIRQTPSTIPEDHAISDTTSLHSAHSLTGLVQHPELHEPGLNASIVETASTWFGDGVVSRSLVVGEIALAYNAPSSEADNAEEMIRLTNFQILEKVAANPTFVSQASLGKGKGKEGEGEAGEYTVSLSAIRKSTPTVALKYQIHLDPGTEGNYSPVLLRPAWQCEEGRVSVIVVYGRNPAFVGGAVGEEIVLRNVVISVALDSSAEGSATKASSAMMQPTVGASFKRKAGMVLWRMQELKVGTQEEKLLVRFLTTGPGVPGKGVVEAKWELDLAQGGGGGPEGETQGLGIRRLVEGSGEDDPFADEEDRAGSAVGSGSGSGSWVDVSTRRKLISGRYTTL